MCTNKNFENFLLNGINIKSTFQESPRILKGPAQKCRKLETTKWALPKSLKESWHFCQNGEKDKGVFLTSPWELFTLTCFCDPVALLNFLVRFYLIIQLDYTSSTARGGGGSFKKRKTIGEIGCCDSQISEQKTLTN